jgi:hypothetical protein
MQRDSGVSNGWQTVGPRRCQGEWRWGGRWVPGEMVLGSTKSMEVEGEVSS